MISDLLQQGTIRTVNSHLIEVQQIVLDKFENIIESTAIPLK